MLCCFTFPAFVLYPAPSLFPEFHLLMRPCVFKPVFFFFFFFFGYSVSSAVFNLVLPLHFLSFFFLFLESRIVINAWLSFSFFNLPAVNLKRENLRKSANC